MLDGSSIVVMSPKLLLKFSLLLRRPGPCRRSFHADLFSSNRAITKLARDGDLATARKLFDEMPHRDIVSWNSMMSAYARAGFHRQVLETFLVMRQDGITASPTSFSILLSSCGKLGVLETGGTVHGLALKCNFLANDFVGTSLITMYSGCYAADSLMLVFRDVGHSSIAPWNALISGLVFNGRAEDARGIFDSMPRRNVVSWTSMLTGYVEAKRMGSALELFHLMPTKNAVSWSVMLGGFVRNHRYEDAFLFFRDMLLNVAEATIASTLHVIGACSGLKDPKQSRMIHCYVIKHGLSCIFCIESALVAMYICSIGVDLAKLEFGRMDRKFVGSWNSLICGYIDKNDIDEARSLFDLMDDRDDVTWNSIINGYLRCGRIGNALELLLRMPNPTIQTYSAFISSLVKNGRMNEARGLFDLMPERDIMIYSMMISGYLEEGSFDAALGLFHNMPFRNVVAYNIMISGFARHGMILQACNFFKESPEHDDISWNALVVGYARNSLMNEALLVLNKMLFLGISFSESSVSTLLGGFARLSMSCHGELCHGLAIKSGYETFLVVKNSLITMYSKCGNVGAGKFIFDHMEDRDLLSWNAMICGFAANGFAEEGINLFKRMKCSPSQPDAVTFLGILSACTHNFLIEKAEFYLDAMFSDRRIQPNLFHYACMVDLYCRIGSIEKAKKLIYLMPFKPDAIMWTSLLSGCRSSCNIGIAELAAENLITLLPNNLMPYLHLDMVYFLSGRWRDSGRLRTLMNKKCIKRISGCSWI